MTPTPPLALIDFNQVTLALPTHEVLIRRLSFSVREGDRIWIRGPNGSGKSTLLRAMAGTFTLLGGTVKIYVSPAELGYLPQLSNKLCHLPFQLKDLIPTATLPKAGQNLSLDLTAAWNTSSGGERQQTLLTWLLSQDKKVFLLDEPFNHLDTQARQAWRQVLSSHLKATCALVFVSHESYPEEFPELNQTWEIVDHELRILP
jgi:ABC-type Mn2+/Zn2+ transport system ATPase subunit